MSVIGPFNKQDLIKALGQTHQEVRSTIGSLPLDDLYDRSKDNWSPSDTLRHLVKCVKPITLALRLPRTVIGFKWGKSDRPSRQYHEMRKFYQGALARGAQAGSFAPEFMEIPAAQDDAESIRTKVFQNWDKAILSLTSVLESWPEMYFDKYFLPHPILGKITVREMIMFTIYHNVHHLTKVQKLFADSLRKQKKRDEEDF